MKILKYILALVIILSLSKDRKCYAQNFADKEYYLIDSLILEELSIADKKILENSLHSYHNDKKILNKINSLTDICENLISDTWIKYQFLQYKLIEKALTQSPSSEEKKQLQKFQSEALNNIGYIYDTKGDVSKSIENYHKSLALSEEINNIDGVATTLNNIGVIYHKQNNILKALEYYIKCLSISKELNNKNLIAQSYNNIGAIYQKQGKIPEALEYHLQSLKIHKEIKNKRGEADDLNNIGSIYSVQNNIPKALEYYTRSLNMHQDLGNKTGISNSLSNVASLEFKKGNTVKALKYALESLEIGTEIGSPLNTERSARLLVDIYKKQNNGMQALKMHQLYILMRDSINNKATQEATANQQAKYEYEKQKAIDDAEHEKLIIIEQEQKEKQKILTYTATFGLALVLSFLFFIYKRLKITRKQKNIIEIQHTELANKSLHISDSIDYAKRIQQAVIPSEERFKKPFNDAFVFFKPRDVVSGDFYWQHINNETILFAAADCTGHGVPGAFMSLIGNNLLDKIVSELGITQPNEILNQLNIELDRRLKKDAKTKVKDGMDLVLCSYNTTTKLLHFSGAHNSLYLISDNKLTEYKTDRLHIGDLDNTKNNSFTLNEIQLQQNDCIYLFSDGFPDQKGGDKQKKFYYKPFRQIFLDNHKLPMNEQKNILHTTIVNFMGKTKQVDDMLIIGIKA